MIDTRVDLLSVCCRVKDAVDKIVFPLQHNIRKKRSVTRQKGSQVCCSSSPMASRSRWSPCLEAFLHALLKIT